MNIPIYRNEGQFCLKFQYSKKNKQMIYSISISLNEVYTMLIEFLKINTEKNSPCSFILRKEYGALPNPSFDAK